MSSFFPYSDTTTTEIHTLYLHDALPISRLLGDGGRWSVARLVCRSPSAVPHSLRNDCRNGNGCWNQRRPAPDRSEEHTSELQSLTNLVCRLLLEKKKKRDRIAIGIAAKD